MSTSEKSRGGRKTILQSLQKAMAPHGAKYTDDGRAGFVEVRKVKIFLKPEKFAVGVVLKPSFISKDIVDKDLPFSTYYKTLHSAISNHKTMTPEQKELLLSILDYHNTFSSKDYVTMKKMMGAFKDAIPLSTINNDFGEILGPFAVISKKLLPVDRRTAKVFIPGRSNEPLLDYKIHDAKTVFKISAKSGDSTNTSFSGNLQGAGRGGVCYTVRIECRHPVHPAPCYGFAITLDGRKVAFCTDTGVCPNAVLVARDADLLIAECGLRPGEQNPDWPHLNPADAIGIARDARAKRLALIHFAPHLYPTREDRFDLKRLYEKDCPGLIVATDDLTIEV